MRHLFATLLIPSLLLAGCQRGDSFRVVDATTGQAIEGVRVTYEHYTTQRLIPGYETWETRFTDSEGRVTIKRSVGESKDHIEFRHPSYQKYTTSQTGGPLVEMQPKTKAQPTKKDLGIRLLEILGDYADK
ncbi:MAG: hypothetical protein AAGB26_00375 [Planctomycetota bacterium]